MAGLRRHPSKRVLREWLAGEIDEQVDEHVSTCDRCATDLESLAGADLDSKLRDALLTVLEPAPGLVPRTEAGVAARLESREVLGYLADIFGAGWETARLLATGPDPREPDPEDPQESPRETESTDR